MKSKGRKKKGKKEYGGVREKLSPISHGLIKLGLQFLIYLGEAIWVKLAKIIDENGGLRF